MFDARGKEITVGSEIAYVEDGEIVFASVTGLYKVTPYYVIVDENGIELLLNPKGTLEISNLYYYEDLAES